MNDRVNMTEIGQGPREPTRVGANKTRRKGLFKQKGFGLRVKLMRGQGKKRSRISSSAE